MVCKIRNINMLLEYIDILIYMTPPPRPDKTKYMKNIHMKAKCLN